MPIRNRIWWPTYDAGGFLFARDLTAEQQARSRQLGHHNRFLHDWGVVCGLWVVPSQETGRPWSVQVCPGYAIGCCGEEIHVRTPTSIDVREQLWRRPNDSDGPAYIGIRYAETQFKPEPAVTPECGCTETRYESSRIGDNVKVEVFWDRPDGFEDSRFNPCGRQRPPCPTCPDSAYIVLARITLPASESDPITLDRIFRE